MRWPPMFYSKTMKTKKGRNPSIYQGKSHLNRVTFLNKETGIEIWILLLKTMAIWRHIPRQLSIFHLFCVCHHHKLYLFSFLHGMWLLKSTKYRTRFHPDHWLCTNLLWEIQFLISFGFTTKCCFTMEWGKILFPL